MADQDKQATTSSVFISYSRKDKEFVRKLNDALDNSDIDAWVDWEGIPLSADWMDEITRAIEKSDAFVFVISPDSLASQVCGEELELGLKYNKKLVPVLHRMPEKGTTMHEKISSHNWVYLQETDDFEGTIPKLIGAIRTDLDWVRQHTRLLQRAKEWDRKNRNNSFLLQGSDLEDAEAWRSKAAGHDDRNITALQSEYVDASRQAAIRRQRQVLIGVSLAFVVSIVLAIYAVFQSNLATENAKIADANAHKADQNAMTAVANEHLAATAQAVAEANEIQAKDNETRAIANEALAVANEKTAKAQRSAALAQIYQGRTGELFTSTLLAIDSWQREPSFQAEDILRQNISQMPIPMIQGFQAGRINNVEFNPDGARFVAASSAGTACVWDAANGSEVFCEQHAEKVVDAFFINNGEAIITASLDGSVRLLSATDGSLIKRYDFAAPVLAIALTPDEKWLAVAREDNAVSIVNLSAEREINTLSFRSAVTAVEFSPNGAWLGMGLRNGAVRIWRLNTEILLSGPQHGGEVYFVAFSPDSNWIVSVSEDSTARVAPTGSGGQRYVLPHDDWLEDVAFGPSSDWFVTVADDFTIRVFDTKTGQEKLRMLQEHFVQEVKVSPDGEWIASTGWDYTVRVWNANTGSERIEIPLGYRGSALAFSDDGNRLLVGESDGHLSIWDISSLSNRVNHLDFPELLHEAIFSPDGEWLAVNSDDYKVRLLSKDQWLTTKSGTDGIDIIDAGDLTYDMAFSPDSKWLVVAEGESSHFALLYNMADAAYRQLEYGPGIKSVTISPDSKQVAVAGRDDKVVIWDTNPGDQVASLAHSGDVLSLAYNPAGNQLLTGQNDLITIWDTQTYSEIGQIEIPGNSITHIAFSRDGHWLAASSSQGFTRIWENSNNEYTLVATFQQNGQALSLDFNPDASLLAIGGAEGMAYLIDMHTHEEIARIPHLVAVSSVNFTNDGTYLVTVARKNVQFWDVNRITAIKTEELVFDACSRITTNVSETLWKQLFFTEPYHLICPDLPIGN